MSNDETYDLENTQLLFDLFTTPQKERDPEWVQEFFAAIPTASLRSFTPQIQKGPDGFSYFILSLPASGEDFDAFSLKEVIPYCLDKGLGIALFGGPDKLEQPEWVFPFGSLWSYDRFQNFVGDPSDERPEPGEALPKEELEKEREILIGAPSDEYLPAYARAAIAKFLRERIGLESPRVALVTDPVLKPSRSLMFADLQPDRFEKPEHFERVMYSLRWFLPATRGLMAGMPQIEQNAVPL